MLHSRKTMRGRHAGGHGRVQYRVGAVRGVTCRFVIQTDKRGRKIIVHDVDARLGQRRDAGARIQGEWHGCKTARQIHAGSIGAVLCARRVQLLGLRRGVCDEGRS